MTKIGGSTTTQQATKTQEATPAAPPPPADDDAVSIDVLSAMKPKDAFAAGGASGAAFVPTPTKPPPPGPDLAIDGEGMTVESGTDASGLGALPPPRAEESTFESVDEAAAAIESAFGVVVDKTGFSVEELSRIHEALLLTGPDERAALRGVVLERQHVSKNEGTHKGGTTGAEFLHAEYDDTGAQTKPARIALYDAGAPQSGRDDHDRRVTQHVVLHEVGHVVDERKSSDAEARRAPFLPALKSANAADAKHTDAVEKSHKALEKGFKEKKLTPEERDAALDFLDASKAWTDAAIAVAKAKTPEQVEVAQQQMTEAAAARDAAQQKIGDKHPLKREIDRVAKKEQALHPLRMEVGDRLSPVLDPEREMREELANFTPSTKSEHLITNSEAAFTDATAPEAPLSPHGASAVEENFAEAYAVYRRDPAFLKENFPSTYEYMKTNYP